MKTVIDKIKEVSQGLEDLKCEEILTNFQKNASEKLNVGSIVYYNEKTSFSLGAMKILRYQFKTKKVKLEKYNYRSYGSSYTYSVNGNIKDYDYISENLIFDTKENALIFKALDIICRFIWLEKRVNKNLKIEREGEIKTIKIIEKLYLKHYYYFDIAIDIIKEG